MRGRKLTQAEELSNARERELYAELLDELSAHARRIASTASVVAQLDVITSFADRARRWNYCRPVIEEEPGLLKRLRKRTRLDLDIRDDPLMRQDEFRLLSGPAETDVTEKYFAA